MANRKMLVFDMDGVLLDSEPLHASSMHRILRENGVTEMPDASLTVGKSSYIIWTNLQAKYGLPGTPATLLNQQYTYLLEEMDARNVPVSEGLVDLLQECKEKGMLLGVASSSNRVLVDGTLKHLGIGSCFDVTVAGDEIPEKKPNPAVYLKAIEKVGVRPEEALAIEDSETGLLAASRAGIPAVGYRNPTSGNQDLSNSIGIVDRLTEVGKYL